MDMYKALQTKVEKSMKEREMIQKQEVAAERAVQFKRLNQELQQDLAARSEEIRRKRERDQRKAIEYEKEQNARKKELLKQ